MFRGGAAGERVVDDGIVVARGVAYERARVVNAHLPVWGKAEVFPCEADDRGVELHDVHPQSFSLEGACERTRAESDLKHAASRRPGEPQSLQNVQEAERCRAVSRMRGPDD